MEISDCDNKLCYYYSGPDDDEAALTEEQRLMYHCDLCGDLDICSKCVKSGAHKRHNKHLRAVTAPPWIDWWCKVCNVICNLKWYSHCWKPAVGKYHWETLLFYIFYFLFFNISIIIGAPQGRKAAWREGFYGSHCDAGHGTNLANFTPPDVNNFLLFLLKLASTRTQRGDAHKCIHQN